MLLENVTLELPQIIRFSFISSETYPKKDYYVLNIMNRKAICSVFIQHMLFRTELTLFMFILFSVIFFLCFCRGFVSCNYSFIFTEGLCKALCHNTMVVLWVFANASLYSCRMFSRLLEDCGWMLFGSSL